MIYIRNRTRAAFKHLLLKMRNDRDYITYIAALAVGFLAGCLFFINYRIDDINQCREQVDLQTNFNTFYE